MSIARPLGTRHRPLVSIVTPTRNRAYFLERTLRSVRNQTYRNLEHIVIDGASTDETIALLRNFETTFPLRWRSEPDGGMYEAINKGLQEAHGEIVAYLNSDDLYLPWALDVVVEEFASHPEADFVYGGMITIEDRTGAEHLHFQRPFNLDFVRRAGFLGQPAVFWRRRVLESEGLFDTSLRYVADCDYWMRCGANRTFRRVTEFLAVERDHEATLRESESSRVWDELAKVRGKYVKTSGFLHRIAVSLHAVRRYGWLAADWSRFCAMSLIPGSSRKGPWSRLLNAGVQIQWSEVLLRILPRQTRRRNPTIQSKDDWLEPPANGFTVEEST